MKIFLITYIFMQIFTSLNSYSQNHVYQSEPSPKIYVERNYSEETYTTTFSYALYQYGYFRTVIPNTDPIKYIYSDYKSVYRFNLQDILPIGAYDLQSYLVARTVSGNGQAKIVLVEDNVNYWNVEECWYSVQNGTEICTLTTEPQEYDVTTLIDQKFNNGFVNFGATGISNFYHRGQIEIILRIYYKLPMSITADNNFLALGGSNRGTMNIDSRNIVIPLTGYFFSKKIGQSTTLIANSPQNDNQEHQRIWHAGATNPSNWTRNGEYRWPNQTYSFTVAADDDGKRYVANLRKNFAISRNDQKEFDGISSAGVVTHIVEQNSGNVPVLSPFNLNGRSYKFGQWIGTSGDNFMPNDNTTLTAFYKPENLSNNAATFSNNNQKKVAWTGWKVYESSGSIWLERNNQLMNNGRPVNNLAEGPEAKSPSLDYILNSSYESTIYVTYQQKTSNGKYKIKLAKFNNSGQLIFNVDVFTSTIDFSAIDAAPVIAVTKSPALANNKPKFLIVWKQKAEGSYQNGLYYFGGIDNGSTITWYYLPPQKFSSTDINSVNPTMSVYKYPSNIILYHIAWEQGLSHIRYRGIIDNWDGGGGGGGLGEHGNLETPSSGYGFTRNTNPSITVINTHPTKSSEYDSPKLTWVASYYPQDFFASFRDKNNSQPGTLWNNFRLYYSGYETKRVNINRTEQDNLFAFVFSEDTYYGLINKYVKSTNLSTVQSLNSQVQDLQISNGIAGWDGMDVLVFNNSTLPYNFSIPETILLKNGESTEGRGGSVSRNLAEFYFGIYELALNGITVEFKELNDSVLVSNNNILNTYLETLPITVSNNSTLEFNLSVGVSDSIGAVSELNENEHIKIKIELIDTTGVVLSTLKEVQQSKDGIYFENKVNYSANLSSLSGQTIKMRMVVNDNLEDKQYSLTRIHSSSDVLNKKGTNQIELNESNIVTEYLLEQNYPNPFNPATNINYQIPEDGFVSLKVYDVLGNEVQTLVNEYKTMGKYTASFDASNLASGVYIYKLKSGEYFSSKKMLLIK